MAYRPETQALHAGWRADATNGAVAVPIFQTTSYQFADSEHARSLFGLEKLGFIYSRTGNPTVDVLERRLAALEGGAGALALGSGQAASAFSVLALSQAGDNIVSSTDLYGGTWNLFANTLKRQGIEVRFVDPADPENFRRATDDRTRAYYGETLPNPKLAVFPIAEVATIGRAAGIPLILDNTAAPLLARPFEHGAAVVVYSATKYLGGHGTSIGGVIIDGGHFDWTSQPDRQPALNAPDPALEAEVVVEANRFFALPEADKLTVQMIHSPHFRGYNRAGQEITRGKQDWREQFDIHAEREPWPRTEGMPAWTRLQGPNQWPAAQPRLREVLLAWQAALTEVAIRVVRAFAEALEQSPDALAPIYEGAPNQTMKIIRYPARDADESDQGVGAHKDSGLLTLLLQDEVGGLQVQGKDGWIDAVPVPGTFVVNIGELLELASNGYLRATVHRVVSPEGRDRLSVAFFLGARLDSTVPVLALPPHLAAEATGPTADPDNPLFRKVGENYLKGRLRSHPDVARRHYADLVEQSASC